jgi:hypothetical protein
MVPVSKWIKGTTLVRNTYLPITEIEDSQGLLKRIEEEKNDNAKADIQSLRGKVETLRMDHDSYWTTEEREKKRYPPKNQNPGGKEGFHTIVDS